MTNAFTESLNSLIRFTNRMGRGYSFEVLRAKILFTRGTHKKILQRPKFRRETPAMDGFFRFAMMEPLEGPPSEVNYGVDM